MTEKELIEVRESHLHDGHLDLFSSLEFFEEFNSTVPSSDSASERTVYKKKRKRYVVNIFPRIVKSDIRRYYPRMIANIFNSLDISLVTSFMETYCLTDFSSIDKLPNEVLSHIPHCSPHFELLGLRPAIELFCLQFELFPDSILILKGSSIKQFRNDLDFSELIVNFEMRGSKLFDFQYTDDPALTATDNMYSKAIELEKFIEAYRFLPNTVDLNPSIVGLNLPCDMVPDILKRPALRPFYIQCQFQLRIVLDQNKRFCSMESSYVL